MKGLELSRRFFEAHKEVLDGFEDVAAAGLFGPGSECFGFDDDTSRDHDFSADFYILIPESEDVRCGVALARAYNALPKEFMGVKRSGKSALGFSRGVMTAEGFFRSVTGLSYGPSSIAEWMDTPSAALAAASNGEVFFDKNGLVSLVRKNILSGIPEDVRRKKLAASAAMMAQAGQYNFPRCLKHGEKGAARLAAAEFAKRAAFAAYLLNKRHMPFYKWCFKSMEGFTVLTDIKTEIEALLFSPDADRIEKISAMVAEELKKQDLSSAKSDYLESHAFSVISRIDNQELKNMHVMDAGCDF